MVWPWSGLLGFLLFWSIGLSPLFHPQGPEDPELPSTSPSHWTSASRTTPIKRAGSSLVAVYQVPHSLGSEHLIPGLGRDKLTFAHSSVFYRSLCVYSQGSWLDRFEFKLLTGNNVFWPDIPSSSRAWGWKLELYFPGWFTVPINKYNVFIHKAPTASKELELELTSLINTQCGRSRPLSPGGS